MIIVFGGIYTYRMWAVHDLGGMWDPSFAFIEFGPPDDECKDSDRSYRSPRRWCSPAAYAPLQAGISRVDRELPSAERNAQGPPRNPATCRRHLRGPCVEDTSGARCGSHGSDQSHGVRRSPREPWCSGRY